MVGVAEMFEQYTNKSVMLLPLGQSDDGAHSQNEKMNINNLVQGAKTLAAFMLELTTKERKVHAVR